MSDRPVRVLQYADELRLSAGGVVRAVLDLVAGLSDAGAEVTLATGDPADGSPAGVPVVAVDRRVGPLLGPTAAARVTVERLVAGADVVHLHKPWDPLGLAFAAACRRGGKPYVVSAHGMLDDWCMRMKPLKKRVFLSLAGARFLRGAEWVHFTTEVEAQQSGRAVAGMRPLVAPLVIDTTPYRADVPPAAARAAFPECFAAPGRRLLFLGRLQAIKGLPTLLDALARIAHEPAEAIHLVVAGPAEEGHDREVARLAADLGLADRTHLLGMVGGDLKLSLYRACDAFVLPSHHENFGIALVEAMLCGLPALTSKGVGIWSEVERLGALVIDHGAAGLAAGVERLFADLPARRAAALANRPAVFDWIDPTRVVSRFLEGYDQAIAANAAHRG